MFTTEVQKTSASHNHFHLGERHKILNELRCDGNEDIRKKDNNEKTKGIDNKRKEKFITFSCFSPRESD